MSTLAPEKKKTRKAHQLQCQHRDGCREKATSMCTRCVLFCAAHAHTTGCCTALVVAS